MLRRISLISTMITVVLLGCGNQEAPTSPDAKAVNNSTAQPVSPKPATSPQSTIEKVTIANQTEANKIKAIATGNIADLQDKEICGSNRIAYAYGETSSFRVYICAGGDGSDSPERPAGFAPIFESARRNDG